MNNFPKAVKKVSYGCCVTSVVISLVFLIFMSYPIPYTHILLPVFLSFIVFSLANYYFSSFCFESALLKIVVSLSLLCIVYSIHDYISTFRTFNGLAGWFFFQGVIIGSIGWVFAYLISFHFYKKLGFFSCFFIFFSTLIGIVFYSLYVWFLYDPSDFLFSAFHVFKILLLVFLLVFPLLIKSSSTRQVF